VNAQKPFFFFFFFLFDRSINFPNQMSADEPPPSSLSAILASAPSISMSRRSRGVSAASLAESAHGSSFLARTAVHGSGGGGGLDGEGPVRSRANSVIAGTMLDSQLHQLAARDSQSSVYATPRAGPPGSAPTSPAARRRMSVLGVPGGSSGGGDPGPIIVPGSGSLAAPAPGLLGSGIHLTMPDGGVSMSGRRGSVFAAGRSRSGNDIIDLSSRGASV
jgi:hypothetical protein